MSDHEKTEAKVFIIESLRFSDEELDLFEAVTYHQMASRWVLDGFNQHVQAFAVHFTKRNKPGDFIDPEKYLLLPNTSGAMNAEEAVRLARLATASGLPKWVKLEIHPDPHYLQPDPIETLRAAEVLVAEGFTVLPYINADPVLAKRLQEVGTATVMPLGSPIGSNRGVETREQIRIIIEQATVPVVVDAGLGAPSHAAEALELGADAVLINTAIAAAHDPVRMARAFRQAVAAGREAYEAGLPSREVRASATSPLATFLRTAP